MSDTTPAVEFRAVSKRYGGLPVLREVDITVAAGEVLAILGPSGSGKSSLLRLLLGLEQPDAGEIFIEGESLWGPASDGHLLHPTSASQQRRLRERVGMVFQHFNLFPHMSVLRNITEAPIHVLKQPRAEAEQKARELLEQVGLGDRAEAWPRQLSGGQKQRVAIARALAMEPAILLLDEVTSALDPELVGGVLALIQQLAARRSMTLLMVTHHMKFAQNCADRVVFVDGGRIVEAAPAQSFFAEPKEARARQFLQALLE